MSQAGIPIVVLTKDEDNVEAINRLLREASHAAHCQWVAAVEGLADALDEQRTELMFFFPADYADAIANVVGVRNRIAPMVPLVVVQAVVDEQAIGQSMAHGARDVVSLAEPARFTAVAERELRSFRLERALNDTLNSAVEYKKQLKAFMAGATDAIAVVQEGILVDANAAWATAFGYPDSAGMEGNPLMDFFDGAGHNALKGALVASLQGRWEKELLRVTAIRADGSTAHLELNLDGTSFDGEPAVSLSMPPPQPPADEPARLVEAAAHRDPTTGFYHRRHFVEQLEQRLANRSRGGVRALAYLRPDKFGEIKDEVGPLGSEDLLVELAEILRALTQPSDLYGRFGGTVFTVFLERGNLRDVEAWADNVLAKTSSHIFEVADHSLSLTCSVGIAEATHDTDSIETLVTEAEKANKRGRQRGGNQVVLQETSDVDTRTQRYDEVWVRRIKAALMENRFRLIHLPVASLSGASGSYYDTLLRMLDESGNEILPTDFLPAAERSKLLKTIDRWVLSNSLKFAAQRPLDGLFVRLSKESVCDPDLAEWLGQQLADAGVRPGILVLQVSEEDATAYLKQTKALIGALQQQGIRFAIEHFGIGRDPAALLNHLPMDYLKIDGSLMQGLASNQALQETVKGFVNAARGKKIDTIAERVEDANTMAVLFQLGVAYMQGHYVHEPEVVLGDPTLA